MSESCPRPVLGICLHLADLLSVFLPTRAHSQPYLWREVLALVEKVVFFTEETFISAKNAIWSLRPCTLLGWATTWQGERIPPHKCRRGSFPFQRPWTTPKVRPAPLSSRTPGAPLSDIAFSSPAQFCRDALPGLSLGTAHEHRPGWIRSLYRCLCLGGCGGCCVPWEQGGLVGLWAVCDQIVTLPNRGVTESPHYQLEGLRRYRW